MTSLRGLLRAFVRHHARQGWVADVVQTRLKGSLGSIGKLGSFGHPEPSADDRVPGLPEWSFRFHGQGCCLTHDDGTTIDVDFVDGTADWIDPYFFSRYLASLKAPEPIEAALIAPEPLDDHWEADLPLLQDAGFLESGRGFRVTDAGRAEAAIPGDGPAPDDATRAAQLIRGLQGERASKCLAALALLGRTWAEPTVLEVLAQSEDQGTMSRALEILSHWADPVHAEAVLRFVRRSKYGFHTHLAAAMVMRWLGPSRLASAQRATLVSTLSACTSADAWFLVALLDSEAGLLLLTRGLSSELSGVRSEAACALAVLGTEESVAVLRATETHEAQAVLGFLRGEIPLPHAAPPEEHVELYGRKFRVYRFDDVEGREDLLADALKDFEQEHGALRTQWLCS